MRKLFVATTLLVAALLASVTAVAQTQSPQDQQKEAETRRAEFKKKVKTLVPSKQERAKYADFLKARNTGIIRLLPREKYITEAYTDFKPQGAPVRFTRKSLQRNNAGSSGGIHDPVGPRGGSTGVPALNEGVLTNLEDLPRLPPDQPNNKGYARDGGAYYSFSRL